MATADEGFTEIDGSVLEGGGQIVRMAAAFSAVLGKPIHLFNIRAGRDNPGLRPQHMQGLCLVRDLCNGKLRGGKVGSKEVWLTPGPLDGGQFVADTKTAGSVTLLMQVALPCLAFARKSPNVLTLRGGTNVSWAPQIEYYLQIFKPLVERFGVQFECECMFKGFYPRGGGEIEVKTPSRKPRIFKLSPIELLDRGKVERIFGRAWVAGPSYSKKFAEEMATAAEWEVRAAAALGDAAVAVDAVVEAAHVARGDGAGLLLGADTLTGVRLGVDKLASKHENNATALGKTAAQMLLRNLAAGGCVDEFLQDQLIIFAALADGKSVVRCGKLTLHTETAIYISQLMTNAQFSSRTEADGSVVLEIDGIGFNQQ